VILSGFSAWALLAFQLEECPVHLARARLAYTTRQFDQAVSGFEWALSSCSNPDEILLPLAQAQLMAQRFADSVRTLERLLERQPGNVEALKLTGDAQYLSGDAGNAEKTFLKALAIDPQNSQVGYALGRMYYQESRYSEAASSFEKVLAHEPSNYRAHDNLALVYEALDRDNLALKHYLKALDLVHKDHPEYDWVYGNLAGFMLRRGDNEKAFQLAAEASRRNTASPRNLFLTGKALYKLDKIEQSIRWLKEAIRIDPGYPEPRYLLGQIYRRQGLARDAQTELDTFRELSQKRRPRR
jgi:tetratricopeptide (TPR) repeat protein